LKGARGVYLEQNLYTKSQQALLLNVSAEKRLIHGFAWLV